VQCEHLRIETAGVAEGHLQACALFNSDRAAVRRDDGSVTAQRRRQRREHRGLGPPVAPPSRGAVVRIAGRLSWGSGGPARSVTPPVVGFLPGPGDAVAPGVDDAAPEDDDTVGEGDGVGLARLSFVSTRPSCDTTYQSWPERR
jgi:hypothetical protein